MEIWANSKFGEYVDFYCVCIDDKTVAINFGRMFTFKYAFNGWIARKEDMPNYGQLGCSGFIVIGADGMCVCRQTEKFTQYGARAFRHTEAILETVLEDAGVNLRATAQTSMYTPGQKLYLEDMSSDNFLNGQEVTVLEYDPKCSKFIVALNNDSAGRTLAVLPCQLSPRRSLSPDQTHSTHIEIQPARRISGWDIIDEEHDRCTMMMNMCLMSGTKDSHENLLLCLEEHFMHEEALASAGGFGQIHDSFSPMFSHAKDHTRILHLIRTTLSRLKDNQTVIDPSVTHMIANAFHDHVNTFDSLLENIASRK